MQIEKIPVAKLKAAEYNPRRALKPGDAEYEKLKRSITEFGYVEPVIWNKQTGNVVGGHQRLTVMRDLGITEIDCVVVDLDPMREKALNVAHNKIQVNGTKISWPLCSRSRRQRVRRHPHRFRCRPRSMSS